MRRAVRNTWVCQMRPNNREETTSNLKQISSEIQLWSLGCFSLELISLLEVKENKVLFDLILLQGGTSWIIKSSTVKNVHSTKSTIDRCTCPSSCVMNCFKFLIARMSCFEWEWNILLLMLNYELADSVCPELYCEWHKNAGIDKKWWMSNS